MIDTEEDLTTKVYEIEIRNLRECSRKSNLSLYIRGVCEEGANALEKLSVSNTRMSSELTGALSILHAEKMSQEHPFGWVVITDAGGTKKQCPVCRENVPVKLPYRYCPYCGRRLLTADELKKISDEELEGKDAHT